MQDWQIESPYRSPGPYPWPLNDDHPEYKRIRVQLPDGSVGTVCEAHTLGGASDARGNAVVLLDEGAGESGDGKVRIDDVRELVLL